VPVKQKREAAGTLFTCWFHGESGSRAALCSAISLCDIAAAAAAARSGESQCEEVAVAQWRSQFEFLDFPPKISPSMQFFGRLEA
jgi:hypothetical protein